jgi:uncharacterized Ntn-hydrolase superfamily protein
MKIIPSRPVHTYSVVARDTATGQLGVAVQSHYYGVGPICPWAEAGVGAVATQSFVKMDYGPLGLEGMRAGGSASQVLSALLAEDADREVRQVAMVDAAARVAAHTGTRCIAAAEHIVGNDYSVQANMMVNDSVVPAMAEAYETTDGDLAARLLATLQAAQAAGGDIRGQQSAAIIVVKGERQPQPWQGHLYNLRVEDHPSPLEELARLIHLRRAYILMDHSDELMVEGRTAEAAEVLKQAIEYAPQVVEIRFWAGLNYLQSGLPAEGRAYLRDVFTAEPLWRDLVPRLVAVELFPNDAALLDEISRL